MNTKDIGNLGEVKTIAYAIEQGWTVLTPFGDNDKYDLVIDRGNGFERVQVKCSSLKAGKVVSYTRMQHNTRTKASTIAYTTDDVDLFAIYCRDNKELYIVPSKDIANNEGVVRKQIGLRITPSANNQTKGVMLAEDYIV